LRAPRNQISGWIRLGRVTVGGRPATKAGQALRAGDDVVWDPPPPSEDRVAPEPGELSILYEDPHLVAVDKPAGLVVHPGAGRTTGTLVHRLLARFPELAAVGGPGRPGIVHRIDRGTSGVLLVARTPESYRSLVRAFAGRAVDKRYLGIVRGSPRRDEGTVEAPVGRHPRERKRMAVVARGKPATTGWRVLARTRGASLVEFRLHTGRTHQIRVHAKHLGHPLLGDAAYGGTMPASGPAFDRPALHAWKLGLSHPATGALLELEAPIPSDFRALWLALSGSELQATGPG